MDHNHSPGCPFAEPDPSADPLAAAVHAAVFAFLDVAGAASGSVITIKAAFECPDDPDGEPPSADGELITRITIGIGRQAQDFLAAEYAADTLNREGVPWTS